MSSMATQPDRLHTNLIIFIIADLCPGKEGNTKMPTGSLTPNKDQPNIRKEICIKSAAVVVVFKAGSMRNACPQRGKTSSVSSFQMQLNCLPSEFLSRDSESYFAIFAISRHSLAHARQVLAQAAICLSSVIFSQAAAQSSQHLAQHSQA